LAAFFFFAMYVLTSSQRGITASGCRPYFFFFLAAFFLAMDGFTPFLRLQ